MGGKIKGRGSPEKEKKWPITRNVSRAKERGSERTGRMEQRERERVNVYLCGECLCVLKPTRVDSKLHQSSECERVYACAVFWVNIWILKVQC